MDIDARSFGQLEGEVKALTHMMAEQNKALAAMKEQLNEVNATLSEAKGGWRTLVWIGGASASASAAVTWVINHMKFGQ